MTSSVTRAGNDDSTMANSGLLSGNEAMARGFIDSGVGFVAAFPGGPTTELVYALAAADDGTADTPHVQWSLNEKVALESAAGAAMGGTRAVAVMKHFGANNAADMLFAVPLMFVSGLVIVVGDDPEGHTSHSEQDTRHYPYAAQLPCLEASSPQEAYEMSRHAFELSESTGLPVYLRVVTSLCDWTSSVATNGEKQSRKPAEWTEDHFETRPVIQKHAQLYDALKSVDQFCEGKDFDRLEGPSGEAAFGIVAAGNAYQFAKEALVDLQAEGMVPLGKIATLNPLPEGMLRPMLERCDVVLVIEEIDPIVQQAIESMAQQAHLPVRITGRGTGELPAVGQLTPRMVHAGIAEGIGQTSAGMPASRHGAALPRRVASPRPGNAHRPTFYALRRFALRQSRFVFMGDVGEAASLGRDIMKAHSSMGAGIGMAIGAANSDRDATVVSVVGDGTLFGFALNGVADAVYNRSRLILLVVDNATMESTGGQATPTTQHGLRGDEVALDIEGAIRGVGVTKVEVVDARNAAAVEAALDRCAEWDGVSAVLAVGRDSGEGRVSEVTIDSDRAAAYQQEILAFGCPALGFIDGRATIDSDICIRSGDCKQIAPNAIFTGPATNERRSAQ